MSLKVTEEEIKTILTSLDGSPTLIDFAKPSKGMVNAVLMIHTSLGDVVLRAFDDANEWKLLKEELVYKLLRKHRVPVPETLKVDTSKTIVPFAYSISRKIEGVSYSEAFKTFTESQNRKIFEELGDYMGKIHALVFEHFGDLVENGGQSSVGPANELALGSKSPGPFITWLELHKAIVTSRFDTMVGSDFEDLIDPISKYFDGHNNLIDYKIVPRLLHLDLHKGNILVRDDKIVAILDVEESLVGHNEFDLMRTELAGFQKEAFFSTYLKHIKLDDGYQERKEFYKVSRSLSWLRALISHADNYSPEDLASQKSEARLYINNLLNPR